MRYVKYQPHPLLREEVECYWTMDNEGSNSLVTAENVVADIGIELFFNFGAAYRRSDPAAAESELEVAGSHIVGLRTRAIIVTQSGQIHIFGVRFRPWGLARLGRFPLREITHGICGIEALFGRRAAEIEERLFACRDDRERVRLIDSILLPMTAQTDAPPGIAARLAGTIAATNGQVPIARLCEMAGVGYKRLERAFLREVGVPPKLYARLMRFQSSAAYLASLARSAPTLPDGYSDQSHFIREFKRFAGESPERFFTRQQQISSYLLERERASKSYNTRPRPK